MGGLDEMSNSVAVLHERCRGDGKDLEEKMFEGGSSKGWMERLSSCELEPRGMVDGVIWGVQPKEATAVLILKGQKQLECPWGLTKITGRIMTRGIQMGN